MVLGNRPDSARRAAQTLLLTLCVCASSVVFAQASPVLTGAESLQTNILAWLTPIAVIFVMVLGVLAMANQISWGWVIGAIVGIGLAFGAPQIVAWVRDMFAV